jgi:hypothetical protein
MHVFNSFQEMAAAQPGGAQSMMSVFNADIRWEGTNFVEDDNTMYFGGVYPMPNENVDADIEVDMFEKYEEGKISIGLYAYGEPLENFDVDIPTNYERTRPEGYWNVFREHRLEIEEKYEQHLGN